MLLCFISVKHLIAEAGGDPWAVNRTLQSGHPGQISSLAQAFHDAGQSTAEAEAAFNSARRRFEAAWNRESGDHPINDAAEVQRATKSLGGQVAKLPKIAADLEGIAANLAAAQRVAAKQIADLERLLEHVDHDLGEAIGMENAGNLSMAQSMAVGQTIHDLEQRAINDTVAALHAVQAIRTEYTWKLQRSMTSLRVEDSYEAGVIGELDGHEPETPDQAERDVHAALAGDMVAAARVNALLKAITPEQLAGKVPLTPDQASVLSQLQAQQHGMTTDDLYAAEQRLGEQRGLIGNSWQLMSNPAIQFPRTELKPGALQGTNQVRGSEAELPGWIQRALTSPWDWSLRGMTVVGNIVKDGNPIFQRNTGLDRAMMRQASTTIADKYWQLDSASPGRDGHGNPFEIGVMELLAAVAPDHQVVHDALTGPGHGDFLTNITHHAWSDQGKAVAALFDWTEGASRGPEAHLAADVARACGSYLGATAADLLHLPGNHTLGEANPLLVRGMAHGLTPYIANIAEIPGGITEFGFLDTAENRANGTMPIAKGIFSVLSSDRDASDYFNGHADRLSIGIEADYAQDLLRHTPNMDSYNARLHDAVTVRGLVNLGIHNAIQAEAENHHASAEATQRDEYDHRKTAYELGVKAVVGATGLVPGVGKFASPLIGIVGQAIENDMVGSAPAGTGPLTDHPLPDMSIDRADREILNAVIALGYRVDGIPPQYLIDGRIASPDELESKHIYFQSGEYDQALSRGLIDMFTQIYGDGPGRPSMPDQYMIDRYNAVVHTANAPKK